MLSILKQMAEIWGLFTSAFISSTIAPGGSEAVLAYLVAQQSHSVMTLVLVATIGNTLGALTTWWLGHYAANKYPIEKVLSEAKQKALKTVRKWGIWVLLFSWLPVVGDGFCFAAGWLKMPLIISTLAILLGKLGRYSVIAYLFV